jgi:hypothetical protein
MTRELVRLSLRIRHIRNVERLASFGQRDPRIPQACIMFAFLGIVCFLRQRCAPGGGFPCGLALGSRKHYIVSTANYCELASLTFRRRRKDCGAALAFLATGLSRTADRTRLPKTEAGRHAMDGCFPLLEVGTAEPLRTLVYYSHRR